MVCDTRKIVLVLTILSTCTTWIRIGNITVVWIGKVEIWWMSSGACLIGVSPWSPDG